MMLLKSLSSSSSSSSSIAQGLSCQRAATKHASSPLHLPLQQACRKARSVCAATTSDVLNSPLTGVVFQPFVEVQDELVKVPVSTSESLARQRYSPPCEAAINEQINVEYNASYVYHNLFAYFDRDNVALPGFARFFKDSSDEEREHAEKIMKYQNKRGGRVKLQSIVMPPITEFDDAQKGDALCAMELTLALEKLVNEKLLKLHKAAEEEGDPHLTDFIEGEFLKQQVEDIKKVAQYVSRLRRVGKGHGVYHFDLELQGKEAQ